MADPKTYPDNDNIEQAKTMLSIQAQILDNLRKQGDLYNTIGKINRDVQAEVMARGKNERVLLDILREQTEKYHVILKEGINLQGDEAETRARL